VGKGDYTATTVIYGTEGYYRVVFTHLFYILQGEKKRVVVVVLFSTIDLYGSFLL